MLASACGGVSHETAAVERAAPAVSPETAAVPLWRVLLSDYELDSIKEALDLRIPTMEQVEFVPEGARVGWIQVPSILRLLGLASGDVITHLDGEAVNHASGWGNALSKLGGRGTLRVRRGETLFDVEYVLQLAPPSAPHHLLEQLRGCWRLPYAEVRITQRADNVWQWNVRRRSQPESTGTTSTFSNRYNPGTHSVSVPCTTEIGGRETCRIRVFHGDPHLMNDEATPDTRLQRCED